MIAQFILPSDPRWETALSRMRHDFYHDPGYVALCAKEEGAVPTAFYAAEDGALFLAPLLLRSIPPSLGMPPDWCDCVSPYGYSTPLMAGSEEQLAAFLEAYGDTARARGIVTTFFRLHPLLPLNPDILGKFGRLVQHGQTVYIDLSRSKEELWRHTREDHRSDIRKLERKGYRAVFDDWRWFDSFIVLYYATMKRLGAREHYLFSRDYFSDFRAVLGDRFHLCCVVSQDGDLACGGTYVECDGIVQGHLAGTATSHMAAAPSKLMQHAVRNWAKDTGKQVFHLGGGVGAARDTLFQFKAGFAKERAEFFTYRMVTDESRYALLTQQALSQQQERNAPADFFPLYRWSSP
jgi:hypothetical protein